MMNTNLFATVVNALTNLDDTQGTQLLAIINGMSNMQVASPVVEAPAKPKVYGPAEDIMLAIIPVKGAGNGKKAFKLGYGAGRAGAKLLIKNAGFAWDSTVGEKGAYVGTNAQYKALGIEDNMLPVSAQWVQAGRDKAAEKAAKKGA